MSEVNFGKYRLIAELGHGGMADVFLAVMAGPQGSGFSKLTVIKRLRQNLADEPEFVEMLVDEARISARLNHPNVVQTNEVGSVGNQYFIAMEYLDGQPLHRIQHRAMQLATRGVTKTAPMATEPARIGMGPLTKECQYLILADTLAGLHHAHELTDYDGTPLQIVHRDVTPHNIFVTYEGQVKVVDFGIAKAVGRASETRQGVVKGKVRYMAPEQARGQAVDRRADVFSVGTMLWEVASGRRLWKDMDDLAVVQALVSGAPPPSPREYDPAVPDEIVRICAKALAPNVNDRYATAEELRVDLEQFLADTGELVHARRRLGQAVSELFNDKRTEIRGIIEKQLAALKDRGGSWDSGPVHLPIDPTTSGVTSTVPGVLTPGHSLSPQGVRSSGAVAVPIEPEGAFTNAKTSLYAGPGGASVPPSKGAGGARTVVPVVLGAVAVLAVAGFLFRRSVVDMARSPAATASATVASASPAPSTSSVASAVTEISVKLSTLPSTAKIVVDGATVSTPFDGRFPRDAKEHTVHVEAPGFESQTETVRFDNDVTLNFTLAKAARAAAPVQAWRPPPPKSTIHEPTPAPAPAPVPQPAATPTTASSSNKHPKPKIDDADPWAKGT